PGYRPIGARSHCRGHRARWPDRSRARADGAFLRWRAMASRAPRRRQRILARPVPLFRQSLPRARGAPCWRMNDGFRSLADADAVFTVATPDGALLPVYELHPRGAAGAALLLGHANGLPAGSYGPWLKDLARDVHVFAFDARGHGGATWPNGPLERVFHVDRFADDLQLVAEAVIARRGAMPLSYLGHSLGGAAALDLAAADRLPDFAGVMLIEPPVFPPLDSPVRAEAEGRQALLVEGAKRRRADWPSVEAFHDRLKNGNSPFARFAPEMLDAHCRAALK